MKQSITLIFLAVCSLCYSQTFTRADTLRGSITAERAWWDVQHYELDVTVNPKAKYIEGTVTIAYKVLESGQRMQIDLQAPMNIDQVQQNNQNVSFRSEGAVHLIQLDRIQLKGDTNEVVVSFSGSPREAINAPWDGGWSWKKDGYDHPFIATSNQGIGASVWWPNKDHAYDEPDNGARIKINVPKELVAVSNGRLTETIELPLTTTYIWEVVNPINNYGININIADYVNFNDTYKGEKGILDVDYWVLRENLAKAKQQFEQVPMMLEAFEHWFGPYPFYEDSFKLVEVPYLGMEHQSSVTYGNRYTNGYLGRDLSGTGWGLKFDFIIIHEAGHEWFANNITHIDVADMWIHEGFTAYSEGLYLDYHFGRDAGRDYVIGTRRMIRNDRPLIGTYNVHHEGSSDMYYKGANILHTLRQWIDDDELWRDILRGLNSEFYHQTVSSDQVERYIAEKSGLNLQAFWQQYLRTTNIPNLQYHFEGKQLYYRYADVVDGFEMPVRLFINGQEVKVQPNTEWKELNFKSNITSLRIKKDFFITTEEVVPKKK